MTGACVARTWLQIYHILCTELTEGWSYTELRALAMDLTVLSVKP